MFNLKIFAPELVLIGTSLLTLLIGAFAPNARRTALWLGLGALAVYGALSLKLMAAGPVASIFSGMIAADSFALFFKVFFSLVTACAIIFSIRSNEFQGYSAAELVAFLLSLTLGMSMMAASTDLLMMFLSLEMVSVLSYVLVGYKRKSRQSSEAGLKYILYGAVASGVMVFGFSFLFGFVGSTGLHETGVYFRNLQGISTAPVVVFALLCVLIGLGYKMATFPSQMWCPDVYEGAPLPVTAFLSVGPKAAGFAMTIRFFYTAFDVHGGRGVELFEFIHWGTVLAVLAAITMTIGNLAAIPQRNLKRLMAYSSIAHAGYLLMGVATLSSSGIEAVLFYFVTYLLMNFGTFFIILVVANHLGTEEIDGYRGLAWRSPVLAILLLVFLCSLTGLPPFAGFIGKLYLFSAVIHQGMYWIAGIAAVNTVVSLFYYFRIVRAMFFEAPVDSTPVPFVGVSRVFAILLAIPTLALGLYWKPVWEFAAQSVTSLFS